MKAAAHITIAGSPLTVPRHVCAFFNSPDEEYRVLLPFVKEGFDRGDVALHILSSDQREDHLKRLSAAGIDTAAEQGRGKLELKDNRETYLQDGRFDPDRMLSVFEDLTGASVRNPALHRIVCQMEWATDGSAHVERLIEFESRVNDLWRRRDDAVICIYQLSRLGAEAIVDILRTHPMVIIGGILQHNPFFTPPEAFLRELRERRARQTVGA